MTKIYYFSGTGNTCWSARRLSEQIPGSAVFNIGVEMGKPPGRIEAEALIILCPAYAYGIPLLVRRFIRRVEIQAGYVAALVSFGTSPGGALAEINRLFRRKKIPLSYGAGIPSVENYIPLFGVPREEEAGKRLVLQKEATGAAAAAILSRQVRRAGGFHPLAALISSAFKIGKSLFVKGYKALPGCTGCGLCSRICPAGAITMQGGRPRFRSNCEHCQACLNWCPERAITYIRLKPDTPRYHHPEIGIADMFIRPVKTE